MTDILLFWFNIQILFGPWKVNKRYIYPYISIYEPTWCESKNKMILLSRFEAGAFDRNVCPTRVSNWLSQMASATLLELLQTHPATFYFYATESWERSSNLARSKYKPFLGIRETGQDRIFGNLTFSIVGGAQGGDMCPWYFAISSLVEFSVSNWMWNSPHTYSNLNVSACI